MNTNTKFMNISAIIFICLFLFFISCGSSSSMTDPDGSDPMVTLPTLSVGDASVIERDDTFVMNFELRMSISSTSDVTADYTLNGMTAEPNVDFETTSGSISIPAGERSANIPVTILGDKKREVDEEFSLTITSANGADISDNTAIGIIVDNDDKSLSLSETGYETDANHYGYDLLWSDEFDGDALNMSNYNFDIGDGCPDLCGWGNNELEVYTDLTQNIKVSDGNLVITAIKDGNEYSSAKIHTKDKLEFKFGRIDIRAKLPEGQGIWPALWMLGANIDEVGWPACGEVDIMELVGHEAFKTHGTAHWGQSGGASTFKGSSYTNTENFSEEFHVFSLIWETNKLTWFVDETEFNTLTPAIVGNAAWRFNEDFYLIYNVAVGGNWPGDPDETTVFPQSMEIDYVRVFQRN